MTRNVLDSEIHSKNNGNAGYVYCEKRKVCLLEVLQCSFCPVRISFSYENEWIASNTLLLTSFQWQSAGKKVLLTNFACSGFWLEILMCWAERHLALTKVDHFRDKHWVGGKWQHVSKLDGKKHERRRDAALKVGDKQTAATLGRLANVLLFVERQRCYIVPCLRNYILCVFKVAARFWLEREIVRYWNWTRKDR